MLGSASPTQYVDGVAASLRRVSFSRRLQITCKIYMSKWITLSCHFVVCYFKN